jgi:hypothetical protein
MPRHSRGGAIVGGVLAPPLGHTDSLSDAMSESSEEESKKITPRNISLKRYERIRQGFVAYIRDLRWLLEANHEGHMVAYLGPERIGIAPTDEQLHRELISQPRYARQMKQIFVTRVTELDEDKIGIVK